MNRASLKMRFDEIESLVEASGSGRRITEVARVAELVRRPVEHATRISTARSTALTAWDVSEEDAVTRAARDIVDAVRERGDAALLEYTQRFDRLSCASVAELELDPDELGCLRARIARIGTRCVWKRRRSEFGCFTKRSVQDSFEITDSLGNRLGNRVTPIDRVGIYVPGGQAAYPSTVLMTAIPARGRRRRRDRRDGADARRRAQSARARGDAHRRCQSRVLCRRRAGDCGARIRYANDSARRQNRWAGRCVRRCGEATRIRSRWNRRDCRAQRNSRDLRRLSECRLACARSVLTGRARCGGASDLSDTERRASGSSACVDATAAAEHVASRHDCALVAAARRVDSHARSRRSGRNCESYCAGTPGTRGGRSRRAAAVDPPRGRDFRRSIHQRSAWRLRCRAESRVADVRYGSIRIAARRVRLSEALIGDSMFGRRRRSARPRCIDTGRSAKDSPHTRFLRGRAYAESITTAECACSYGAGGGRTPAVTCTSSGAPSRSSLSFTSLPGSAALICFETIRGTVAG